MKRWLTLVCGILLCVLFPTTALGSESTAYTYTISIDGEWVRTQDAYLPGKLLFQGGELNKPSDLYIQDPFIYVSNSGNGSIVVYNINTGETETFGGGILKEPRGLFVTPENVCYVADYSAECVFVFNADRSLRLEIKRPSSILFSDLSRYKPTGVAVTSSGVIYVVGEGSYEGIMQFNADGEFQGYYAANQTPISLLERIQEMIFSEEQLNRLLNRTPRSIKSIDINEKDLVFSVTQDANLNLAWHQGSQSTDNNVKLHNFAGTDILRKKKDMVQEWNYTDVAAGRFGNCFTLTETGVINEYDSDGNIIFSFGGRAVSSERIGFFTAASAIDTDNEGLLYVLDSERALVQIYSPTDFAETTYSAIAELQSGNYAGSEEIYAELLKFNAMSRQAHDGYANSLFYQKRYDEAMEHYYIAENREGYSECFWYIRDSWINKAAGYVLSAVALALVIFFVSRLFLPKWRGKKKEKTKKKGNGLTRDLSLIKSMIFHPIDTVYTLKHREGGSVLSAVILYVVAFILFVSSILFSGFIFRTTSAQDTQPLTIALLFIVPVGLWIAGNTFVSSINEGEGSFRGVFVCNAYALSPYIVLTPIMLALTYVLTINESFVIQLIQWIAIVWSGALMFVTVLELHNYNVRNGIKNVLLTLFFMLMTMVVVVVLILIWEQAFQFISSIVGEVFYRATA